MSNAVDNLNFLFITLYSLSYIVPILRRVVVARGADGALAHSVTIIKSNFAVFDTETRKAALNLIIHHKWGNCNRFLKNFLRESVFFCRLGIDFSVRVCYTYRRE